MNVMLNARFKVLMTDASNMHLKKNIPITFYQESKMTWVKNYHNIFYDVFCDFEHFFL